MGILDDAIREHLELKRRHGADSGEVSRQEREILGADGAPAPEQAHVSEDGGAEPVAYSGDESAPVVEPLAGSPLAAPQPEPVQPLATAPDLFPGTNELMAAASETPPAPPAPVVPAPATPAAAAPLRPPAPADADSETAARSGARRLSDDELAAWRRRLSERADRLAAQRPAAGAPATAAGAGAAATPAPAAPEPAQSEPPAYWSGNTASADAGTPPSLGKPAAPAAPAVEPTAPGVPADFFDAGDAEDAFSPEPAPEPVAETPDHDVLDDTPDFLEETPEHDRMWFEQKPPRDFDFG